MSESSLNVQTLEKLTSLAREVSEREGCLLYDIEFGTNPSGRVLRVFIDRPSGPVSIDDCANVSRGLNQALDADEQLVPGGAYELEVSSPGIERRLREDWHFSKALGELVRLKLIRPLNGGHEDVTPQKLIDGQLKAVEGADLLIEKDGRLWRVPMGEIEKAQVRFEMNKNQPSKGRKKKTR